MNPYRPHRFMLTAVVLLMFLMPVGVGVGLAQAGGEAGAAQQNGIQPFENHVFLPCITRNACFPIFTDIFSNPTSGWLPMTFDGVVVSGYYFDQYRIFIDGEGSGMGYNLSVPAQNYRAAVTISLSSYPYTFDNPYVGLIFGLDAALTHFYEFDILPNQWWTLWRYDPVVSGDPWTLLDEGQSMDYIHYGAEANRLAVERNGSSISVYANNHLLGTVTDATYLSAGYFALSAENNYSISNLNHEISFYFDDFGIYPLTCEWSAIFP